ncbi:MULTISPECIES: hypothetical protein [unclassified Breznakia]|uniref:hypothetical protein n=1 Tax=unclassified Breznakia TaxID=2623764 RepID=UPI002474905D|nr:MULTISPECIES: hypothetical protein [unclassified Breznakia]MDH6367570.1 F0F1-type ATP synthase delta subunit [Breznakia sp. PH1-1]MDH6404636.1 F0F1-type ATP synthase delta subunit [Breznakia sp. PF1-11]MDH6412400.1 F0F1-type ATP synthase delta subunit [Breznakia sp. PFB1-11]MDH6414738.1 F0F1-type ATP synthase delta subunit [Breznakia sp. PFB1-14]MDH6417017.1 F0F1-type ATP synthase delta subunit [Breznakia sp. PFB1-4]
MNINELVKKSAFKIQSSENKKIEFQRFFEFIDKKLTYSDGELISEETKIEILEKLKKELGNEYFPDFLKHSANESHLQVITRDQNRQGLDDLIDAYIVKVKGK